ncbi:hypothetical protein [Woodsholea maritima]|uniref:hypothetical protein n=1 Tax=Woodsholea maritima TaxID=240237 RepID=UPI00036D3CFA|nr:hypothetical protein [Woodsholea maritima]
MEILKEILSKLPLRWALALLLYIGFITLCLIRFEDSYIQNPTVLGLALSAKALSAWILAGMTSLILSLSLMELQDHYQVKKRAAHTPPEIDQPLKGPTDEGRYIEAQNLLHMGGVIKFWVGLIIPVILWILGAVLVIEASASAKYDVCVRSDQSRAYYCHTRG